MTSRPTSDQIHDALAGCGERLRAAREAAGMSVDDVAARLHMPARVVRGMIWPAHVTRVRTLSAFSTSAAASFALAFAWAREACRYCVKAFSLSKLVRRAST